MEEKFRFLDTATADVCFEAYGKTLEEVFENAALALFEVMVDTGTVEGKLEKKVEVSAHDLESLMFAWLNELIFYVDAENIVFSEFRVRIDENVFSLSAVCRGEKINPNKHELRTAVKSCTYHGISVEKNALWKARVIVDI